MRNRGGESGSQRNLPREWRGPRMTAAKNWYDWLTSRRYAGGFRIGAPGGFYRAHGKKGVWAPPPEVRDGKCSSHEEQADKGGHDHRCETTAKLSLWRRRPESLFLIETAEECHWLFQNLTPSSDFSIAREAFPNLTVFGLLSDGQLPRGREQRSVALTITEAAYLFAFEHIDARNTLDKLDVPPFPQVVERFESIPNWSSRETFERLSRRHRQDF